MDPPQLLALVDQEIWLREHGIAVVEDQIQEETAGERDEQTRVISEQNYADQVIGGIMKEFQDEDNGNGINKLEVQEGASVTFVAHDDRIITDIPLRLVVSQCDYLAMILESKGNWNSTIDQNGNVIINLKDYPIEAVQLFADMLRIEGNKTIGATVPGDILVDCCRIAHFLCAESILNAIHDELLLCVDNTSCLVLCRLGEELGLSRLFEASLSRMMDSLDTESIYDDLTPELCDRILQIKGAINTSLHSGNRLFFGSLQEYLSIFAERVEYFKERLFEAREQFALAEREMSLPCRIDTQMKISKQEKRLATLQVALKEQRKVFLSDELSNARKVNNAKQQKS